MYKYPNFVLQTWILIKNCLNNVASLLFFVNRNRIALVLTSQQKNQRNWVVITLVIENQFGITVTRYFRSLILLEIFNQRARIQSNRNICIIIDPDANCVHGKTLDINLFQVSVNWFCVLLNFGHIGNILVKISN